MKPAPDFRFPDHSEAIRQANERYLAMTPEQRQDAQDDSIWGELANYEWWKALNEMIGEGELLIYQNEAGEFGFAIYDEDENGADITDVPNETTPGIMGVHQLSDEILEAIHPLHDDHACIK